MRILALDAALGKSSAALIVDGVRLTDCHADDPRGAASVLAGLVAAMLESSAGFDAVAVTVGPGSFTGVRAALSLAHGLALGAGVPVVAVTSVEALECAIGPIGPIGRDVWIALDTRRGKVFLGRRGSIGVFAVDDLDVPDFPVEVGGDAAALVHAALLRRGADISLSSVRSVDPLHVGLVAAERLAGRRPPLTAQPLYGEPPAARLQPALRPAPV